MKKQPTGSLALIGLLFVLAATPAFAQGDLVTANIPFEFGTANGTLPAGRYTVTEIGEVIRIIVVRSSLGKSAVVGMADRIVPNKGAGNTTLAFRRYGSLYFLAQVTTADDTTRQLQMTTTEQRVVKNWPDVKLALDNVAPEVVTVVAAR